MFTPCASETITQPLNVPVYPVLLFLWFFQGVWLCHSGHILPKHVYPYSSTNAFWLCHHCQGATGTRGGASCLLPLLFPKEKMCNESATLLLFAPFRRGFHIQRATAFGQNGRPLSREVVSPRQLSVVSFSAVISERRARRKKNRLCFLNEKKVLFQTLIILFPLKALMPVLLLPCL